MCSGFFLFCLDLELFFLVGCNRVTLTDATSSNIYSHYFITEETMKEVSLEEMFQTMYTLIETIFINTQDINKIKKTLNILLWHCSVGNVCQISAKNIKPVSTLGSCCQCGFFSLWLVFVHCLINCKKM